MNCNFAHYHADDIPTDKGPKLGGAAPPKTPPCLSGAQRKCQTVGLKPPTHERIPPYSIKTPTGSHMTIVGVSPDAVIVLFR